MEFETLERMNVTEAEEEVGHLSKQVEMLASEASAALESYKLRLATIDQDAQPLEYEATTRLILRWLDIQRKLVTIGF